MFQTFSKNLQHNENHHLSFLSQKCKRRTPPCKVSLSLLFNTSLENTVSLIRQAQLYLLQGIDTTLVNSNL